MMNRVLVAFVAVLGCCGLLKADATYAWKTGEYPTSILGGKVTFTYADDGGVTCIQKMNVTAAEGETITFTGDKMQFVPSSTATIKQLNSGKVVFQNEVAARTFDVTVDSTASAKRNRAWKGYSTFVGTDWTTVFENANLDDSVLLKVQQCEKDPETGENIPNWSNRGLTLTPCHIKRSPGFVACQYQGNWGASSAYVVCIWAEFRQSGDDIQMRIVDAGWIVPLDPENIFIGVDPDALCGRYTWNHHAIRTTGNANSGCGMDAVSILSMNVVYRFENKVTFGGSPSANAGVRLEFADASKVGNTLYAVAYEDSEIVFQNGSQISDWHSNAGAGTLIFETTKIPASASETNCIEITGEWKKTGAFRIRGIEGAPMILRAKNQKSYPTGEVIVESNGILDMNGEGENASRGVKNGACAITVNKGGVLRQSAKSVFGTNQVLTVNGGTIELGVGDPYEWDFGTALYQVTLRDGARLVSRSSSATKSLRIGRTVHGQSWVIGGDSPSTNEVPVQFMGAGNFVIVTNTFNVAPTGGGSYDADFVTTKAFDEYSSDSVQYKTNVMRKVGLGTFRFDAAYTVPGWVELEQGLIRLGKSNLWGTNKNRPVLNLRGGGLSFVSGTSNTMGEIRLYEDASLVVENGATVKFPDLSGLAWTPGKTMNITMPRAGQEFQATVQFGSDATALTEQQLSQIRVNGRKVLIDDSGRLVPGGLVLFVR